MFLKKISGNCVITVTYYQNGSLQTCQGRVYKLDSYQQILYLKDKQKKSFSICLSDIKEIR